MNRLIPGSPVVWKERQWVLLDIPALDRALLRDPVSGHTEQAPPAELRLVAAAAAKAPGLLAIDDRQWERAWRRFEAIRPLLGRGERERTHEEVDRIAHELGKNRATIYRWISRWESTRTVSALVRSTRSDVGRSRLPETVNALVEREIEGFYLVRERPSVVELWERIALACRERGAKPPTLSTLRRRVERLQGRLVMARRHGTKRARETYEPIRGAFPGADVPRAVYQIDHSPIDLIFVDEAYRRPIGRGYLTIVTDSCTRMLAGCCVSLDPPGALSAGLALAHAILPKDKWLVDRGIDAAWPLHGIPAKVYADNATEFRGTMLERACREYGIVMENRPKGLPNYGGHVERLFRTFMHRAQSLPGTTFSNVAERGDYDSERKAAMTLAEFEHWFGIFVTKVYHERPHRGIGGIPPLRLYEQFVLGKDGRRSIGLPEPIADEAKLRLDFMPFVQRTVQEYGVVIDNIHYYSDVLRAWIHARDPDNSKLKRKFVFVRDPRDISTVYFLDPTAKAYHPVPYRDLTRPPMSLWELNAVLARIAERPELQPNEDTIFEGLAEMSRIEMAAVEKSKRARRTQQRRQAWRSSAAQPAEPPEVAPTAPQEPPQAMPFDDIEEAE